MAPEVVLEVEADRCEEEVVFDIVDGSSSLRKFDGQTLVAFENVSPAGSNWIRWHELAIFRQAPARKDIMSIKYQAVFSYLYLVLSGRQSSPISSRRHLPQALYS